MALRHQSAIKRARQSIKRSQRNRSIISSMKTAIKKVRGAVEEKDLELCQSTLRKATSELHKAVTKGALHRNTASRLVSRLANRVNSLSPYQSS
ncbi:30S ribosomal protein S20 [Nitrospira sp. M1]